MYCNYIIEKFLKENKEYLSPFNIKDANKIMKGELNAVVCTATGVEVRIICTDAKGDFPVIGLIDYGNNERPKRFTANGLHRDDYITDFDLYIYNKNNKNN